MTVGSGVRPGGLGLPAFSLDGSCIGVSSTSPGCEGPGSPGSGLAYIVPMYNAGVQVAYADLIFDN